MYPEFYFWNLYAYFCRFYNFFSDLHYVPYFLIKVENHESKQIPRILAKLEKKQIPRIYAWWEHFAPEPAHIKKIVLTVSESLK